MVVEKLKRWLLNNTNDLSGKTVAVTGSTGGLGRELCRHLAGLSASLVLVDRNSVRSEALKVELLADFEGISVECVRADLEDIVSVRQACEKLSKMPIDVFIHNAGAYSIPRHKCAGGYDNVFQINFISPYYMIRELLPTLRERQGRVVVVSSIAHDYSRADRADVDFSGRDAASKVYGNAKRYLTYSLFELFAREREASLSVTHPGISFTNITAHYPRVIFALIKHPMKIIFMKPRRACLSVLRGVFESCGYCEWIGPRILDVWGLPKKKKLNTATPDERAFIGECAERIYSEMKNIDN